ncbi:MAG TPA: hypothetical protein VK446_09995 [Methylocystis sp.]|nr:hypothetical protein [Methylocystis sp.]HXZ16350.1 hypothetical protein [Roseiarcus sp.]
MNKLAKVQAARPVAPKVARAPVRRAVRRVDPAWVEFVDHAIAETAPLVAIALEAGMSLKTGRLSLRAVLLVAALAI